MKITTLLRLLVIGLWLATGSGLARAAEATAATDPLAAGAAALARHDFAAAIASYSAAIKLNPKDPAAYFYRGQAYGQKGDTTRALSDFSAALALNPRSAPTFLVRALAYAAAGDNPHALADANEAIRLDPGYATALGFRGEVYLHQANVQAALADFNQALQLDPRNFAAYFLRATLHQDQGDHALAIADLNQALQLNPESVDALNSLAWTLATSPEAKLRNGARALQYALKACDLTHWKQAGILDTLAAVYAEIGDFEEAVKWQQKAVALMPTGEHSEELRDHLKLYRLNQPFHEPPRAEARPATKP